MKRAKIIQKNDNIATHSLLIKDDEMNQNTNQIDILQQMKNFRPPATIFEIGNTTKNGKVRSVMTDKRQKHHAVIDRHKLKKSIPETVENDDELNSLVTLVDSNQDDIKSTFTNVVHPKALTNAKIFENKKKKITKDKDNFIGYQSKDHHTEAGYAMLTGFEAEASKAVLDLTGISICIILKLYQEKRAHCTV